MNTRKKVIIAIVAVLLVASTYEFFEERNLAKTKALTAAVADVQSYFCTEGQLKATYTDQSVTLGLLDGRTVVLPQVRSGSGVRYEKDTMAFITKGTTAVLQEKGKDTYTHCLFGSERVQGERSTFTDGTKLFSFSHPKEFLVSGDEIGYSTAWHTNTQTLGLVLASTTIPKTTQPNTNFSNATFTVGTSSDPQALKECLIATNGEVQNGNVTINGTVYQKMTLGDAGAGNFYDTTSYHTVRNEQCYIVEYTIHSTSIGAYSPDQGIVEFNKNNITETLESMVSSFTFL
jgi:membrane-bound inhibitor of C-type lysozyme